MAQAYLSDGGYYWNSGIFLFAPAVMTREFKLFRDDIADTVSAAIASARLSDGVLELGDEAFAQVPSELIDVAIMERTRSAALVPCDIGWADIGSWNELWRLGPHGPEGNRLRGDVLAVDTRDTLVWSDGIPVGVIGLEDVVVVAAQGAVLVAAKSHLQQVRTIAAEFTRRSNRTPEEAA